MVAVKYTLTIQADIDPEYVKKALEKSLRFIAFKKPIDFYVIDHANFCPIFAKDLPKEAKELYINFCKESQTSMSITWNNHEHILIHITPEEDYLRTNEKALIGTIIHEIIHSVFGAKLDNKIGRDMHSAFDKFKKQLKDVKYTDKQVNDLYSAVSEISAFVLTDIYGNSELIKRRLGNYLYEDYVNLYACKKRCAKPSLPSKRNKLKYAKEAFDYELSLLSVIIPFMRSKSPKAKKLVKHLEKKFESNVPDVATRLKKLKRYAYRTLKDSSAFRKEFFTLIFEAVYETIK